MKKSPNKRSIYLASILLFSLALCSYRGSFALLVNLNEFCTHSNDCLGAAICVDEACICPQPFYILDGLCVETIASTINVNNNNNGLNAAISEEGQQQYSPLYTRGLYPPVYQQTAYPGDACSGQTGCLGNANCESGICVCARGLVLFGTKCVSTPPHSDDRMELASGSSDTWRNGVNWEHRAAIMLPPPLQARVNNLQEFSTNRHELAATSSVASINSEVPLPRPNGGGLTWSPEPVWLSNSNNNWRQDNLLKPVTGGNNYQEKMEQHLPPQSQPYSFEQPRVVSSRSIAEENGADQRRNIRELHDEYRQQYIKAYANNLDSSMQSPLEQHYQYESLQPFAQFNGIANEVRNNVVEYVNPGSVCNSFNRVCCCASFCVAGICVCQHGYQLRGSVCTLAVPPSFPIQNMPAMNFGFPLQQTRSFNGGPCHSQAPLGPCGSVNNGAMFPLPAAVLPTVTAVRSYRTFYPGSPCDAAGQCSGGSNCVAGYCACPAGLVISGITCAVDPLASRGAPAAVAASTTACPLGTQYSPLARACLPSPLAPATPPIVRSYACDSVAGCAGGAICSPANQCVCQAGQAWLNGVCSSAPTLPLGGPCGGFATQFAGCSYGAQCNVGQCQCSAGYFRYGGICRKRKTN